MLKRWLPLRAADGGSGGSGSDADQEQKAERATRLVEKHSGDALKLALMIVEREQENARYREELRTLKGKVPADDALVLGNDDAAKWQQYTQLGTPDDLTAIKTERDTFAADLRQSRRVAAIQQAASAEGLHADKLEKLLPRLIAEDAVIAIREVGEGQAKTRQAFVQHGDTETRLIEVDGVADVLDALKLAPDGIPFPRQTGGSGTPKTREQLVAEEIERKRASGAYG
jgi:hypothetical protein